MNTAEQRPLKEGEYHVESILGRRSKDDSFEYLIKWKDWPHQYDTWEPIVHLHNIIPYLTDFERQNGLSVYAEKYRREMNNFSKVIVLRVLRTGKGWEADIEIGGKRTRVQRQRVRTNYPFQLLNYYEVIYGIYLEEKRKGPARRKSILQQLAS